MGSPLYTKDTLATLRQLDEVWGKLEQVVLKCATKLVNDKAVTMRDERRFSELIGEAQVLYGRVSGIVGGLVRERYGRQRDAFQHVLATGTVSELFHPMLPGSGLWLECCVGARSMIRQAIGRLEEQVRRDQVSLTPEMIARWQGLIAILERLRLAFARGLRWLAERPRFLDRWLQRLEGWPLYRFARVVTTFAAFIMLIIVLAGIIGGIVVTTR